MGQRLPNDRRGPRETPPLAALAVAAVAVGIVHAPALAYGTYVNVDEGYAAALAGRLEAGASLYVDAVSQRGPLYYGVFRALAAIAPWHAVWPVRIVALATALAAVASAAALAKRLGSSSSSSSSSSSAAAAAATWAALCAGALYAGGVAPYDAAALHAEALQAPLVAYALVLALDARILARTGAGARAAPVRAHLALALFGAAAALKPTAIPLALPALVALVAGVAGPVDAASTPRRAIRAASLVAAFAAVPAACLVAVARAHPDGLAGFVRWVVVYNLGTHARIGQRVSLLPLHELVAESPVLLALVVAVLGLGARALVRALARARTERGVRGAFAALRGPSALVGATLAVALVTGAGLRRFFPHYFLPALPPLAALAGAAAARACAGARGGGARAAAGLVAAFVLVHAIAHGYLAEKADGRTLEDPALRRAARLVEARSAPDARVFVWGFSPSLYGYARRRAAGRFLFGTYVTGLVPWAHHDPEGDRARAVPGAVEALLDDLRRERPAVVVDAGSVMLARPLASVAPLAAFVREGYALVARVGPYDVYADASSEARAGGDAALRGLAVPAAPVDFRGRPLPVVVPAWSGDFALPACPAELPIWPRADEAAPEGVEAARLPRWERRVRELERALGEPFVPPACRAYLAP